MDLEEYGVREDLIQLDVRHPAGFCDALKN